MNAAASPKSFDLSPHTAFIDPGYHNPTSSKPELAPVIQGISLIRHPRGNDGARANIKSFKQLESEALQTKERV
jgi:hypothetical protein